MCIRDRSKPPSSEDISTNSGPEESLLEHAATIKKNKINKINLLLFFIINDDVSLVKYTLPEYFTEHLIQTKLEASMQLL